ncbi:MAG: DUF1015 domain-containing protein [Candidatus Acidiferrales bacterium]
MAEVHAFRAYRYDANRVALEDVLTQPYDKITPAMQERYYARSPYNLIAVEKGRTLAGDTAESNVYTRAAQKIEEWMAEKILVKEAAPSIYIYAQNFQVPGTQTSRTRIGFIALGRVEDYDAHVVFRHERTLSAPKADRIELLRRTRAQTGQLFMLYDDPARAIDALLEDVAGKNTARELRDELGVTHRLWPVSDEAFVRRVQNAMAEKKLVIADGHHRYETALAYRNECRAQCGTTDPMAAHEFAMMTFINAHSKGLVILPTHRLVSHLEHLDFEAFRERLAQYFDWYAYPFSATADRPTSEERAASFAEFRKDLQSPNRGWRAIGVYPARDWRGVPPVGAGGGAFYLFVLRRGADLEGLLPDISETQRQLDIVLLHRLILEKGLGITGEAVAAEKNVGYEREMDAAIAAVDRGEAQLAFLLNPARVQQVTGIALGGGVLPQKSTDFYPKLLSGVAIYRVEGHVEG